MNTNFYAHIDVNGKFTDIYPSKLQVKMAGQGKIYKIKVKIEKNGGYWGWLDKNKQLSMLYNNFKALKMCFPYGIDVHEKHGDGIRVELSIEETL